MTKRKRHQKTSLGLHLQKGKTMLRHREQVAFCQPGSVVSPDINPADSTILDFFSELWENKIILFKPSSLCYSAMTAPRENILQYTFTSPFFFLFSFSFTSISCVTVSVWGMCVCVLLCMLFSRVHLFVTTWTCRLLCLWDFPGKKTGVGCHVLLQGIFLTQGSNSHLLHLLPW